MLADKHGIEAFFHQLLAGPSNGVDAGIEGGGDLAVPPGGTSRRHYPQGCLCAAPRAIQSVNPRPARAQRRGTTRMKPPPGVPWDAGGGANAGPLTLSHLETDFPDAQVTDFAGGFFVPFLTLCRLFRV